VISSNDITFTINIVKNLSTGSKFVKEDTHTRTSRQNDHHISLLLLLKKESWLKITTITRMEESRPDMLRADKLKAVLNMETMESIASELMAPITKANSQHYNDVDAKAPKKKLKNDRLLEEKS
jgi:hypothetical protein